MDKIHVIMDDFEAQGTPYEILLELHANAIDRGHTPQEHLGFMINNFYRMHEQEINITGEINQDIKNLFDALAKVGALKYLPLAPEVEKDSGGVTSAD